MPERTLIRDASRHLQERVVFFGWVHARRDHGKVIFIDLRDRSGILQVVLKADAPGLGDASRLRSEWVISVEGTVRMRPKGSENPELETGMVELSAEALHVLGESKTPPFDITLGDEEIRAVSEELRLAYRYLDLRRPSFRARMVMRAKVCAFIREFLAAREFVEIETPLLSRSTPEGARDFLVPSRLHKGNFYALPQSPQQYKQLLMVAGMERYFQIARCFRDEDSRKDRQYEFTQLDLEMSFTDEVQIMRMNEELLVALVKELYPKKKIQEIPFPHIRFDEAMKHYGSDRPDMRKDKNDPTVLAFCWVTNFPFFERTEQGGWTFTHNPFSAPRQDHAQDLIEKKNLEKIVAAQYDIVLNGAEIGGGSIRNSSSESLRAVFEIIGLDEQTIEKNFGQMLEAFQYGTPPHGGIAWGLDRLVMLLHNETSIREGIAFPKTGDGLDPMMHTPSPATEAQLKELGMQLRKQNP